MSAWDALCGLLSYALHAAERKRDERRRVKQKRRWLEHKSYEARMGR